MKNLMHAVVKAVNLVYCGNSYDIVHAMRYC